MDGAASSAATAMHAVTKSPVVRTRVRDPSLLGLAVVQRASEFSHIALCCCLGS